MVNARVSAHLIHMLAKQATPMTASSTTLGRVPAKLSTRVINTRSMFVFESAAAIVKPPMRSMIVGENITENVQLRVNKHQTPSHMWGCTCRVAAAGLNRPPVSGSRITLSQTNKAGTMIEVTKSGIAYRNLTEDPAGWRREWETRRTSVAHRSVTNTSTAKHRFASSSLTVCTFSSIENMRTDRTTQALRLLKRKRPTRVRTSKAFSSVVSTGTPSGVPPSPRRSRPIICLHTVSRSHAMCSRR
jgi:hypothetical protein